MQQAAAVAFYLADVKESGYELHDMMRTDGFGRINRIHFLNRVPFYRTLQPGRVADSNFEAVWHQFDLFIDDCKLRLRPLELLRTDEFVKKEISVRFE